MKRYAIKTKEEYRSYGINCGYEFVQSFAQKLITHTMRFIGRPDFVSFFDNETALYFMKKYNKSGRFEIITEEQVSELFSKYKK